MLELFKLLKKYFVEPNEPKSTDIVLRGLNRNGDEYVVTIPTFPIKNDSYHIDPCFIRAGVKRK